jgi:hypothetical protein
MIKLLKEAVELHLKYKRIKRIDKEVDKYVKMAKKIRLKRNYINQMVDSFNEKYPEEKLPYMLWRKAVRSSITHREVSAKHDGER